ncbi:MAG: trypsin-like peptidase domain-containing protein [Clostridiales bacterium]|nr:trypsin-like peptidase domain-containing protein [Eubacteriales bacterium]MDH7565278.1 trypsin-like peptidase domain-containing protein [Clostridiales bacterium]
MDNFDLEKNDSEVYGAGGSQPEKSQALVAASFYTENYKKPSDAKRKGIMQMVLVALISSILGGFIVGSFFVFGASGLQTSVTGFLDKMIPGNSTNNSSASTAQSQPGLYKKVEIVQNSDSAVTAIAEKVGPSVVGIKVTVNIQDFFFGQSQQLQPEGSGIIISSDGYILTNNHVISDAIDSRTKKMLQDAKIEVYLPNQQDKPYKARYVASDIKTDLAVLKIEATGLQPIEFGNSDDLKVGELAVAIGNPGGMELAGSVTVGVISGINRSIQTEDGVMLKLIQTDAAINPGNSGGALVNSKGQLIGVNRLKIAATGYEGLGFAIPSNLAKRVSDDLVKNNYVTGRPLLGIATDPRYTEDVAKRNNMPPGVYVAEVSLMSGAQKAGIQVGDVITKIDGKAVKSKEELDEIKNTHKVGDEVTLEIYRDGKTFEVKVKLTEDKG